MFSVKCYAVVVLRFFICKNSKNVGVVFGD